MIVRLGQLSYAVGQAVDLDTDALLMIDKSSPRHKHDNRYKVDGESHASIHRVRADIADVDLGQVPLVRNEPIIPLDWSKVFASLYVVIINAPGGITWVNLSSR